MTANKREAMAAPEMRARATIRSNDAVFCTVVFDNSKGIMFGIDMAPSFNWFAGADDVAGDVFVVLNFATCSKICLVSTMSSMDKHCAGMRVRADYSHISELVGTASLLSRWTKIS
jgi:hypothetical protein